MTNQTPRGFDVILSPEMRCTQKGLIATEITGRESIGWQNDEKSERRALEMLDDDSQDTLPALLKTRIQDWLREDGWGVLDSPPENLSWRLSAEEAGRQVGVYMRPDRVDEVILEAIVEIGDIYQAALDSLAEQDRMDVLLDLAMELTGREFEMGGLQNPVEGVSIRKSVYYDGISKDLFMQRANSLKLGAAFIQSFIQRRLRPQPALSGSARLHD